MNAPPIRLGEWHQAYLYGMGTILVLSGALWLLFQYYVRIPGEFGPTLHPLQPWFLIIHGLSAAGLLIGFGSVMPGHVRRAWRAARNRITGSIFFGVMLALTISGYLLYYVGNETARALLSIIHWVVGLSLPILAGWHIWRGRVWRHITMSLQRDRMVAQRAHNANAVPDTDSAGSRVVRESSDA